MDSTRHTRTAAALMGLGLLTAGLLGVTASPAQAVYAPVKKFANCTAMHKVYAYRGGIKRVGAHDHRTSGVAKYKPFVSTKRYNLNAGSDRDKDGVACEQ
jgi:hypothetical protein